MNQKKLSKNDRIRCGYNKKYIRIGANYPVSYVENYLANCATSYVVNCVINYTKNCIKNQAAKAPTKATTKAIINIAANVFRFAACAVVCIMLSASKMMVGFPDSTNANSYDTPKTESNKDIATVYSTIMSTKKTSIMDRLIMVENPLNNAPPITEKIEIIKGL